MPMNKTLLDPERGAFHVNVKIGLSSLILKRQPVL